MTKIDKEIQEGLYDPAQALGSFVKGLFFDTTAKNKKKQKKGKGKHKDSAWMMFVKQHKDMRTTKGLLDLKAISKLWHEEKGYDPAPKASTYRSCEGQRESIVSEAQRAAMFSEINRRESRKILEKSRRKATARGRQLGFDPSKKYDIHTQQRKLKNLRAMKNTFLQHGTLEQYRDRINEYKEQLIDAYRKAGKASMRPYDPAPKKTTSHKIPSRWYEAMVLGIKKGSDVRNPYAIVKSIWSRLSHGKQDEIRHREATGETFKYDLPLPDDRATKGTGTLRMVTPFKLAEVQVNLNAKDYLASLKSGLFSRMKRGDGSTALVKRCKSDKGNCNIFLDQV